jgi:DNA-binding response OmpR family regulator
LQPLVGRLELGKKIRRCIAIMRIMVYGSEAIIQGFIDSLVGEEIEVVGSSDELEAAALLKQQRFDLAVVDSPADDKDPWHFVSQISDIPVMLIVEEEANWDRLEQLEVDGYIPDKAPGPLLAALLRAVVRRRSGRL